MSLTSRVHGMPSEPRVRLMPMWVPWLLPAALLAAAVLACVVLRAENRADATQRFQVRVERAEAAIAACFREYHLALEGGAGLFAASKSVERSEWRAYAARLDLDHNYPGVHGIGYISAVPAGRSATFVALMRADEAPEFSLSRFIEGRIEPGAPQADRAAAIITFIEPVERSRIAIGLDIASEPLRCAAVELARDSGRPTITAPITLAQDRAREVGFLLLLPIYANGQPTDTLQERRAHHRGFVYAPFLSSRFLGSALASSIGSSGGLQCIVHDLDAGVQPVWKSGPAAAPGHALVRPLQLANRTWTFRWWAPSSWDDTDDWIPWAALALGAGLAAITAWTLRQAQRTRGEIERKVRARTAELASASEDLRRARDAAEAGARAKSEFLATVSHEIRTPMNGIIGMSEVLLGQSLEPEVHDQVGTIRSSADALLQIINDILDISKIEAGKLSLESLPFAPRACVDDALALFAEAAAAKGIDLACSAAPEVPACLLGDVGRVRQIVINLVGNALKFTVVGSVQVRLSVPPRGSLAIVVQDSGIGISPEQQALLFRPFVQADSTTTRRFGGTGLGLAISLHLAEAMRGGITLASVVGQGSTFTATLDLPVETSAEPPLPPLPKACAICLVPDAMAATRSALVADLQAHGVAVHEAYDAIDATAKLRQAIGQGIALCIAPIELLASLRGQVRPSDRVRFVALVPGRAHHVLPQGADAVLGRPFSHAGVRRALVLALTGSAPAVAAARPAEGDVRLKGLRVLLAEDNLVNQKVQVRLIERLGCCCTVVGDGKQAVDAIVRDPLGFDVVILDCQMPVLDGFGAAVAIRAADRPGKRMPIVALTANAGAEDRARCLAAGMDNFLSKPINSAALREALLRFAPAHASAGPVPGAEAGGASASSSEGSPEPFPLSGAALELDPTAGFRREALRELRESTDPETVRDVVATFASEAPMLCDRIAAALQAAQAPALASAAHALKGAARMVGLLGLGQRCERIERAARANDFAAARRDCAVISEVVARGCAQIEREAMG